MGAIIDTRWAANRRGRGPLPPLVEGLEFFGDLSSSRTSIVSGAVATLGDSSGNARDFTQSTSTKRPTYSSSDANFGGRPSRTYDGVDDLLSLNLTWPGSLATLYVVFRAVSTAGDQRLFGARIGAIDNAFRFAVSAGNAALTIAHPVSTGETQKAVAISAATSYRFAGNINLAGVGTAAVPTIYLNGSAGGSYISSGATGGGPFANATYAEGATDTGGAPFGGTVTDVLVYSKSHSAAEVTAIDDWLKWRNGL